MCSNFEIAVDVYQSVQYKDQCISFVFLSFLFYICSFHLVLHHKLHLLELFVCAKSMILYEFLLF